MVGNPIKTHDLLSVSFATSDGSEGADVDLPINLGSTRIAEGRLVRPSLSGFLIGRGKTQVIVDGCRLVITNEGGIIEVSLMPQEQADPRVSMAMDITGEKAQAWLHGGTGFEEEYEHEGEPLEFLNSEGVLSLPAHNVAVMNSELDRNPHPEEV